MRKSPIKHKVKTFKKSSGKIVNNYLRGKGTISVKLANPTLSIPSIKLPKNTFSSDEIKVGDYVDFGSYGKLYVNKMDAGTNSIRVTDIESDRSNLDASGWYIDKDFATGIIEKFTNREPQCDPHGNPIKGSFYVGDTIEEEDKDA